MRISICVAAFLISFLEIGDVPRGLAQATSGPLRINKCNPRYFSDARGHAVYLTGMHTWSNFQDWTFQNRSGDQLSAFNYAAYLELLQKYHHNFMRLWVWENAAWLPISIEMVRYDPLPYLRTGPGTAQDGLPKFDLTKFNEQYFERLRERVIAARDKRIYVAVMLFQGWSIEKKGLEKRNWLQRVMGDVYGALGMDPWTWDPNNPWNGHPFNGANNVNGIDGDMNHDGEGLEIHTLANGRILKLQEQYVRKVIDTVNDQDNVLYEISNESRGESTEWQYHMIQVIHEYEVTRPYQHPVLMTWQYPGGPNPPLFQSLAEAVSPGQTDLAYRTDPPPADGSKVVIADTDHLGEDAGDSQWVWKSFMRGLNPIFMDRIATVTGDPNGDIPSTEEARVAMGQTSTYAQKMDLNSVVPGGDLCSTAYCLANPGVEYLAYLPTGGSVSIDLEKNGGPFTVEWYILNLGMAVEGATVDAGWQRMVAPFEGPALVYLKAANTSALGEPCRSS